MTQVMPNLQQGSLVTGSTHLGSPLILATLPHFVTIVTWHRDECSDILKLGRERINHVAQSGTGSIYTSSQLKMQSTSCSLGRKV